MKKIQTFLICSALLMGIAACDSSETTSKSSEQTKTSSEKEGKAAESKQEEEKDTASEDSKDLAADFKELVPEMQLAVYKALFYDVIISYDYGIGNPEYLLKDTMTQAEIDEMKKELQKIKEAEKAGLLNAVNETRVYLKDNDLSKVSDKDGLQRMFDSEDKFLQIAAEMIACLDSVTVDNALEKRAQMNDLKEVYVKEAAIGGEISMEVAKNSGMNVEQYRESYSKLIEK